MKSNLRTGILPLAFITCLLLLAQCTGKRSGKEGAAEPSAAEAILRARTMGLAYLEENELEKAETEFQKLIKMVPEEAIDYANLGLVFMRMGRYEEAEDNLLKAVELNPADADIRLNLATLYKYRNENERSVAELEKNHQI